MVEEIYKQGRICNRIYTICNFGGAMTKCKYWQGRVVPIEYSDNKICDDSGKYFTLCLILQGTVVLDVNHRKCYISAPALLCFKSNVKAVICKQNNIKLKSVLFAPEFINRNLSLSAIEADDYNIKCKLFNYPSFDFFYDNDDVYDGIIPVEKKLAYKIEFLIDSIKEQLEEQPDNMWSCRARASLIRAFDYASKIHEKTYLCNIENDTVVDCVLNYIEFNYEKKMSIENFCKWNNTNRTTLMKEFKKATGKTIANFVIDKRIEISMQILTFTNISIGEISEKCGFSSSAYFCKVFKKRVGLLPSDYRKREVENRIKAYESQVF